MCIQGQPLCRRCFVLNICDYLYVIFDNVCDILTKVNNISFVEVIQPVSHIYVYSIRHAFIFYLILPMSCFTDKK